MKTMKLGIIGVGIVAERILNAAKMHDFVDIVGMYDANEERLHAMAEKYGHKAVASYQELLDDAAVDAIYLATPPSHHYAMAMEIMRAGKHILCEKPLANSIEEAREMAALAKVKQLVNGMNFPLMYTPATARVRDAFMRKDIGTLQRVEIRGLFPEWPRPWQQNAWIDSREQGGFTREVFTHLFQLILHFLGPVEISCSNVTYPDPQHSERSLLATGEVAGVPLLVGGATGVAVPEDLRLIFYGDKQTVELCDWRDVFVSTKEQNRTQVAVDDADVSYALLDEMVDAVNGSEYMLVDFQTGYETVEIVETLLNPPVFDRE